MSNYQVLLSRGLVLRTDPRAEHRQSSDLLKKYCGRGGPGHGDGEAVWLAEALRGMGWRADYRVAGSESGEQVF